MKTASKVFLIIGLVCSVILVFIGLWIRSLDDSYVATNYMLWYGIYSLIMSVCSLVAIHGHSKGFVIFCGLLYIPVSLLASIFMFCIDPEDLR